MANQSIKLQPVGGNKYAPDEENSPTHEADDDYDPHLHRNLQHATSNTETLIHILKGSLGTGILAMPEAFKNSGLTNGFVCTILIGILATYCLHQLVQAQYIICKRLRIPMLTYPESMKIALETGPPCLRPFAKFSPIMVDMFLVTYQIGICCVYVLFVTVNIKAVVDAYTPESSHISLTAFMMTLLLPFILINCIRNLKLLAPFSLVSNILTFVSFGICLYYIFTDLPSITERPHFGTLYNFPLFFGTTLFALEAVGVVIAVENNMKTPKSFGGYFGVLNIAMFFIILLYVGMGFLGYWRYGDESEASITLNFPPNDILALIVRVLYSIAIFISYGLQAYPSVQILWETYLIKVLQSSNHLLVWEYLLRIVAVIVTFLLAMSVPLLGLFISLFGAFCLSALGLAFPAIMEICVLWPDKLGRFQYVLYKNVFIIIFGIVGLLAGSYSALSEIVIQLSAGDAAGTTDYPGNSTLTT